MVSILDEIVASKRLEVATAKRRMPLEEIEDQAASAPSARDFRAALEGPGPIQLIAEVKKASPSAQVIRADFDPVAIARTYQEHGAACLSILTDAPYFQGHLSYLARVRASVAIPLLRKDFLIDEYQVVEARLAGADAILLIAEILDDEALVEVARAGRGAGDGGPGRVPRPGQPAPRPGLGRRPGRDQQPRPEDVRDQPGAHAPAPRPDPARRGAGQRERHPHPGRRRAARGGRRLGDPGRRILDAPARHRRWPSSGCSGWRRRGEQITGKTPTPPVGSRDLHPERAGSGPSPRSGAEHRRPSGGRSGRGA